jgi:hypothetical protein
VGLVPHSPWKIVLESSDTAPLRASSRPLTVVFVLAVIEVKAMTLPTNLVPVPRVAELPICQYTLHGLAPLVKLTELAEAVVSVEPTWNTQTALGLPWPLRVRVPVIWALTGTL